MQKRWAKHVFFWLAYHSFEVYTDFLWMLNQYNLSVWEAFKMSFIAETVILLAIKLPMVYLMFYFLSKYTVERPNRWKLVLSLSTILILFSILAQLIIVYVFLPTIYKDVDITETLAFQGIINSFMDKIFIAALAISLKQMSNSQRLREREALLVKEKLKTELTLLKSQINPHFLFNTLNNIYSLARKKSDKTPEVVLKLSKLLRFVMYETKHQSIPIEKELDFLKDYIELHKIRYDDRLKINLIYELDDLKAQIMPNILTPFVENAFKHGASQSTMLSFIVIELKLIKNELYFKVENSFEPNIINNEEEGIGLKNLRRQLELMYQNFSLQTKNENQKFIAELSLNLTHKV
ncbi:sensor histidine kinase [Aequorivita antarctica]|uniref:GHKL domain-containing protein n=1 Tax=Aequorivita antarctica TaxID=153266 RepID=A0A5C6Z187_9FLAO|nr:histidine kinase [Aequorivita antarctica]TXD73220.1 GHKL domain-containing protein [Aequorivita antarctica]SRX74980.1 Sensor histidine kinase YpdA [Aequorivita antarctica]